MNSDLLALRAHVSRNFVMPSGRFFTPKQLFWDKLTHQLDLADYCGLKVRLTDCGTSSGELVAEAEALDVLMDGIDLMRRDEQLPLVQIKDALTVEWDAAHWPLICRPDHGGWARRVIENAFRAGAHAFYVGLPRNYRRDLAGLGMRVLARNIGRDGESLYYGG